MTKKRLLYIGIPVLLLIFGYFFFSTDTEDQVSIMLFTKKADLVLPPTSCINTNNIHTILDSLKAHGGSYLDNGIRSAVDVMQINYLRNGNNRILLATDGLFNISEDVYKLVKKINKKDMEVLPIIRVQQTLIHVHDKSISC